MSAGRQRRAPGRGAAAGTREKEDDPITHPDPNIQFDYIMKKREELKKCRLTSRPVLAPPAYRAPHPHPPSPAHCLITTLAVPTFCRGPTAAAEAARAAAAPTAAAAADAAAPALSEDLHPPKHRATLSKGLRSGREWCARGLKSV